MDVKFLTLEAVKNNKLYEFLEGKEHMEVGHESHFSNLFTPTDWVSILEDGIYEIYKENANIKNSFENVLKEMLKKDTYDIYCAVEIIYLQLKQENKGKSPFIIKREEIIPLLRLSLKKKEESLKKYYEWQGRNEDDGMWGYFKRINKGFISYFGLKIIEE